MAPVFIDIQKCAMRVSILMSAMLFLASAVKAIESDEFRFRVGVVP
jgi:hypothetical protein